MATLGANDLKQYAIPTNWDAATLTQIRLESGETYDAWLSDVSQALAMANNELLADPLINGLISVTTEPAVEYRSGTSNGFEEATEYGRPDAKRAATVGHMLPLKYYDRMMKWTWMFLSKARRAQLDADIADAIQDVKNIWRKTVIDRLFDSDAVTIGSSGKSVPFADGGTADSSYIPVAMPDRGGSFAYTHNHFAALNGITQANLETAVLNLWEHGHDGPYDLLISQSDISSWTDTTNVTGYIPTPDPLIRYGAQTDLAAVAGPDWIGVVETDYGACRIRANARIPTKYWALYKSFGRLDQRNPLRVRYNERRGIGALLLAGDHIREYPLENAIMWMEFGVGVGEDRTAAVLSYNDGGGTYSDPTIS